MPAITDITDSEASFLEIMRENEIDFEMIISRKNGHWIMTMNCPPLKLMQAWERARRSQRLGMT